MTTIKYGVIDIEKGEILVTEKTKFKATKLALDVNNQMGYKRCGVVKIKTTTNIEIEEVF